MAQEIRIGTNWASVTPPAPILPLELALAWCWDQLLFAVSICRVADNWATYVHLLPKKSPCARVPVTLARMRALSESDGRFELFPPANWYRRGEA